MIPNGVSPERVVQAYRETGLTPGRLDFFPEVGTACALGALFATEYRHLSDDELFEFDTEKIWSWLQEKHYYFYATGFADGFDGKRQKVLCRPYEGYIQGHSDGVAAWNAVVDANLLDGRDVTE
jgi:hypothetical protein